LQGDPKPPENSPEIAAHGSAAIVDAVSKAWADVPYPGDTYIFTPESYDDEDIGGYFSGTSWSGHSPAALRAHCSGISMFFTPEAYHYWLPAYLIAAVTDPDQLSQGVDSVLFSLSPCADGLRRKIQNARLALFTKEQLLAVIGVIEYLENLWCDPDNPNRTKDEREVACYLRDVLRNSAELMGRD
jgi:hypothetical protein